MREIDQRIDVRLGDQNHIAASTAITAVGATPRDKLLSMEVDNTRSTITAFYVDLCFVYHKSNSLATSQYIVNDKSMSRREIVAEGD
jgi:hypothetical protein